MCEISKSQRRTFRDQDPPRICKKSTDGLLRAELESSRSTPNSPTILQRASSLEKCFSEPEFFQKQQELRRAERGDCAGQESTARLADNAKESRDTAESRGSAEDFLKELSAKVPSSSRCTDDVSTTHPQKFVRRTLGPAPRKSILVYVPIAGQPSEESLFNFRDEARDTITRMCLRRITMLEYARG
ncbi:hypothetical protein KM043_012878 [Ampulex compressa]|nr:hypothetical protein KM043_012878 [Ampulex compressa]